MTRNLSQQNADPHIPISSSYNDLHTGGSTTTPSPSVELSLSLSSHVYTPLSSGNHEKSSLVFASSRGHVDTNCAGYFSAYVNGPDFHTGLLQPVSSLGPALSPLDPPAQMSSSAQRSEGLCLSASFVALLRAGELAGIANAKTETN